MGYVIASRKSDLARIQALQVAEVLRSHHPGLTLEHFFRPSLGDLNQKDPLWKMPEKGVFTEDFRQGLMDGEFDMVVHSWKDLPIDVLPGTEIVATLPRADMRDLFFCKKSQWPRVQSSKRLNVLTSSPRRMYNLVPFFKEYLPTSLSEVEFQDVRGNVPTRIEKLLQNDSVDGLILAKAAWDRLFAAPEDEFKSLQTQMRQWLKEFYWMVLPLEVNPCAAAQGALAIEVAEGRDDLKKILSKIHCQQTWDTVVEERAFLRSHGGGCHQKIGISVLPRPYGTVTFARGITEAGDVINRRDMGEFSEKLPFTEAESFPVQVTANTWFQREPIDVDPAPVGHHFVARANALPADQHSRLDDCLWTSGLKTWKTLAQRGLWVCGSVESLGEQEDFRLEALIDDKPWLKWTHSAGATSDKFVNIHSYSLSPQELTPDLRGKKNFFWMSGSSFEKAVEVYPEILAANHYCGPGQTFSAILDILKKHKNGGPLKVALGHEQWAQMTWKGSS